MISSSQQLWDVFERMRTFPSGEAARIKTRWFRKDRGNAADAEAFARWLTANGYLTKFALERLRAGEGDTLRINQYMLLDRTPVGYIASDALGRKVNIDLVHESLAGNAEVALAFESACERLLAVQHAHVNRVLDFGEKQSRPLLVRENDEGVTLADVLARRSRLAPDQAAKIFAQAFAGLQALHEKKVPGGELNPDALLLAATGKGGRAVKLLNAGLPPALFLGGPVKEVLAGLQPLSRPEEDLFRLGLTFYLSLTGQSATAKLEGGAAPRSVRELAPDVPEMLADAADHLLDTNVPGRPKSAAAVAKTLRIYLSSAEQARKAEAEDEIGNPVVAVVPERMPAEVLVQTQEPEARVKVGLRLRDAVAFAAGAAFTALVMLVMLRITHLEAVNVAFLLFGVEDPVAVRPLRVERAISLLELRRHKING